MTIKESNSGLIKLLKKGILKAFDAIYKQYSQRIYGFFYRYVKQEEDTEEIVQEEFIKLKKYRDNIYIYSLKINVIFAVGSWAIGHEAYNQLMLQML